MPSNTPTLVRVASIRCLTNRFKYANLGLSMRSLQFLCAAWLSISIAIGAESSNSGSRPMGLQDVMQMALQHNLDVQIERFAPLLDQFALSGAYGAYDPTFSLSA